MLRRLRSPLFAAAFGLSPMLSRPAAAQVADLAPVDASALGASHHASIGLSVPGSEIVAGGGMGIWRGSFHAYVGAGSFGWGTGFAYAHTAFGWRFAPGLHFTLGEQLSSGYRHYDRYGYDGAVSLRMPVGLTLGNVDGASLSLYGAPYGEVGVKHYLSLTCPSFDTCSRGPRAYRSLSAAGIDAGVRASFARVSLGLEFRDFGLTRNFTLANKASALLGVSVQLGK